MTKAIPICCRIRQRDGLGERPPPLGYVGNILHRKGQGDVDFAHGVKDVGNLCVGIVERVGDESYAHRMLFL